MQTDLNTTNCIRTVSGVMVNLINPDPETLYIEDIAHALSSICRFGGHTPLHYSVAQHSVYVSQLLVPKLRLQGLMHDASEAFLMDIPTPAKNLIENYREIEDNMMKVIAKKFGFQYPFYPTIKEADKHMLKLEWDNLMVAHTYVLPCWSAQFSKTAFLKEFKRITS